MRSLAVALGLHPVLTTGRQGEHHQKDGQAHHSAFPRWARQIASTTRIAPSGVSSMALPSVRPRRGTPFQRLPGRPHVPGRRTRGASSPRRWGAAWCACHATEGSHARRRSGRSSSAPRSHPGTVSRPSTHLLMMRYHRSSMQSPRVPLAAQLPEACGVKRSTKLRAP